MLQKQAADMLNISIRQYKAWEYGESKPMKTCQNCVERVISAVQFKK